MAGKSTILVIDDDEDYLTAISGLISSFEYDVVSEINSLKAFDIINSGKKIDVIVADYMMPDLDGLTLKEKLNESDSTKNIPVVIISGYGTPELLDLAQSKGVVVWYDKPVERKTLQSKLKEIILPEA